MLDMPPFNVHTVQESGLVLPPDAALPELSEGKLAISLTLLLLANVDSPPPPIKRVLLGQVAVVWAVPPVPKAPPVLFVTTEVPVIVASVKHSAKG